MIITILFFIIVAVLAIFAIKCLIATLLPFLGIAFLLFAGYFVYTRFFKD